MTTLNTILSPQCQIAFNKAVCSLKYPKCTSDLSVLTKPCSDLCLNVEALCSETDLTILNGAGLMDSLDCAGENWSVDPETCNSGPQQEVTIDAIHAPKCVEYSGEMCKGNTPGRVYIPAGIPETVLEEIMLAQQFIFAVSPVSTGCDRFHNAWTCANTFMECEMAPLAGLEIPVPKLPCKEFCETFNIVCDPLFQISEAVDAVFSGKCNISDFLATRSCSGEIITAGQENYPRAKTTFMSTPLGDVTSTCSRWADAETPQVLASAAKQAHVQCPFPLVIPDETVVDPSRLRILDGACAPPCPVSSFTDEEYDSFDIMVVIGMSMSFVCTIFFTLTWCLFKRERKSVFNVYMNVCLMVMYGVVLINAIRARVLQTPNIASSLCKNNVEEYHFEGYCLAQGIIYIFAALTSVSWWLVQSIDVFRSLVLNIKIVEGSNTSRWLRLVYHVFAWGIPAIFVIVAVAEKQIGAYASGIPYCFFTFGRGGDTKTDFSQGMFFYPMLGYVILGCCLMICVMIRIFLLSLVHENRHKSCWERYMCGVYLRVILYFFLMAMVWIFMVIFKTDLIKNKDEYVSSAVELYLCTLFNQPMTGEVCGAVPKSRMPFASMAAMLGFTSYSGIIVFVIHSTTFDIYRAWAGLFYVISLKIHPRLAIRSCKKYARDSSFAPDSSQLSSAFSGSASQHHSATLSSTGTSNSGTASPNNSGRKATGLFRNSVAVRPPSKSVERKSQSSKPSLELSSTHRTSLARPIGMSTTNGKFRPSLVEAREPTSQSDSYQYGYNSSHFRGWKDDNLTIMSDLGRLSAQFEDGEIDDEPQRAPRFADPEPDSPSGFHENGFVETDRDLAPVAKTGSEEALMDLNRLETNVVTIVDDGQIAAGDIKVTSFYVSDEQVSEAVNDIVEAPEATVDLNNTNHGRDDVEEHTDA